MDIGQGAGLAGATGVRPFLPPLLAGALARGDLGIDFDATGWRFLESPAFLLAVLAAAVLWYAAERSGVNELWLRRGGLLLALVLGALLFGGSLAQGGSSAAPGIVAGVACSALAFLAIDGVLARTARRLDPSAARLLDAYAELLALTLAAVAIFVPPVSFAALAAFALVLVRGRALADRKYAGLRILR